MELGEPLIDFELVDDDGQTIAPSRIFSNYDGLLFIFYSSYCPYSQAYFERFQQLIEDYKPDSLAILFVNCQNGHEPKDEERESGLVELAQANKASVKLINDEDNTLAEAFGVQVTPEAFIFGKQRKLVYRGAIDNAWEHSEIVTRVYLKDALDYALDDDAIDFPEVDPEGTPFKSEDKRSVSD